MLMAILLSHIEHNQICDPGLGSMPAIRSIICSIEDGSEYFGDERLMKYKTGVTIFGWRFVVLHVVSVRRPNRRGNQHHQ